MKKQSFIYNTASLVVAGFLVKILGLVNRIVITRIIGAEGISIYMLTFPTLILFISVAQLGLPIAISKLVSQNVVKKKHSNRPIIMSSLVISLIVSVILITILLLIINPLTKTWLNDDRIFYPVLTTIFLIPLVSFTGILKGYLNGLKRMDISARSQIVEQLVRIILSIVLAILLLPYGIEWAVTGSLLAISLGEFASLAYLLKKTMSFTRLGPIKLSTVDKSSAKDILSISLPATGSRLIGSFTYFFEPILFTAALASLSIQQESIARLYGSISGFAIPLLLMMSFITASIATSLIPNISEYYAKGNIQRIRKLLGTVLLVSFIPGAFVSVVLTIYPDKLMNLIFGTTNGANYVAYMAPLFIIYYFQPPLTATLQALNKAKTAMISTLIGGVIKLFLIFFLTKLPMINSHGLPIATIFSIYFITIVHFYHVVKVVKYKPKFITIFKGLILLVAGVGIPLALNKIYISFTIQILSTCIIFVLLILVLNLINPKAAIAQLKRR